jgi:hypothetical protein
VIDQRIKNKFLIAAPGVAFSAVQTGGSALLEKMGWVPAW